MRYSSVRMALCHVSRTPLILEIYLGFDPNAYPNRDGNHMTTVSPIETDKFNESSSAMQNVFTLT